MSTPQTPVPEKKKEIVVNSFSDFTSRFGDHPIGTSLYSFFWASMIISVIVGIIMVSLGNKQSSGAFSAIIGFLITKLVLRHIFRLPYIEYGTSKLWYVLP